MFLPLLKVMIAEVFLRLFFLVSECRDEWHTLHREFGFVRHPIAGTCAEVPVPRNIKESTLGSASRAPERSLDIQGYMKHKRFQNRSLITGYVRKVVVLGQG